MVDPEAVVGAGVDRAGGGVGGKGEDVVRKPPSVRSQSSPPSVVRSTE